LRVRPGRAALPAPRSGEGYQALRRRLDRAPR
jgi:hypothetical protein